MRKEQLRRIGRRFRGILLAYATWIWFVFGVVVVSLIAFKTAQRMIEHKQKTGIRLSPDDAIWDAVKTRVGNHSTWLILSHCLSIICFSIALYYHRQREDERGPFRVGRRVVVATCLLTAIFWAVYLRKVYEAPDPGTFFSKASGWAYFIQFLEGILNLAVLGAAAFWIAIMFRVTSEFEPRRKGLPYADKKASLMVFCGCFASLALYLVFLRNVKKEWLISQMKYGNNYPGLWGYTVQALAIYGVLIVYLWARCIECFPLKILFGWAFKAFGGDMKGEDQGD